MAKALDAGTTLDAYTDLVTVEPPASTSSSSELCGVVILSPFLESVVLARYVDSNHCWVCPHEHSTSTAAAAAAVAKRHLGIDISAHVSSHYNIEVDLPSGRHATVFIATSVPVNTELHPAPGLVASTEWHSLRDVLAKVAAVAAVSAAAAADRASMMDDESADAAAAEPSSSGAAGSDAASEWQWLVPLLPQLVDFFHRHPQLRLSDKGAAAASELAPLLVYRAATWKGATPREHLAEYCRLKQLSEPCYDLVTRKGAASGASVKFLSATCILTHIGLQITPEYPSASAEEAEQCAALAAMVWMEGGLTPHSHHVRVVPVGFPPLCRPETMRVLVERGEARRTQAWAMQNKDVILQRLDQRRRSLAEEMAGLERAQAALRNGLGLTAGGRDVVDVLGALTRHTLAAAPAAAASVQAAVALSRIPRPAKRARTAQPSAGTAADGSSTLPSPSSAGGAATPAGAAVLSASGTPQVSSASATPGTATANPASLLAVSLPLALAVAAAGAAAAPAAGATTPVAVGPSKGGVQELKEFYDRRRWPQPAYEPSRGGGVNGDHICSLLLPLEAGLGDLRLASGPEPSKKRAKEAVALMALQHLHGVPA